MAPHEHADIDKITGTRTTGHEWDGIRELNTPLPRWWLWSFYLTILWSVGYWIVYPAIPLVSSYTQGAFGWSSRGAVNAAVDEIKARRASQAGGLETASLEAIERDPGLMSIALAQGKAAFADNCVPCHGPGGAGARNYPSLADDDWLWGGRLEDIAMTIANGIRAEGVKATRSSAMPAFAVGNALNPDQIRAVANHVRKIAGLATEPGADLAAGAKVFGDQCAGCHGPEGKGNPTLGAPNLTDAIWLYGSDIASVVATISNPRNGVMPAWADRLDKVTIKALALYVHSLGGGK
jgi:cytochrome c oxidase cbb3-type subunit 3